MASASKYRAGYGPDDMVAITTGDSFLFRDDINVMLGTATRAKVNKKGKVCWEVRLCELADFLLMQLE
jgi:hypothetical protein